MNDTLKTFSLSVSREITERNLYKVDDMALMIEQRFKDYIPVYLTEHASQIEQKYMSLCEEAAKIRKSNPNKYIEIGYEIQRVKSKLAIVNRAQNNVRRESKFRDLVAFVRQKFGCGDEFLVEFHRLQDEKFDRANQEV